ncbi:MAG TPA: hypothetical protein VJW55_09595, partial [Candidatus Angelobacter sp.]|nr:hypothetical protein [Candidatus Angelobacter sp.]
MLRTANPSQRILTSQPDLAYVRTQDTAQTTGLLATASFPISNHLRYREAPDNAPAREPRQIIFDSELSAATFTAALEAIRHQDVSNPSRNELMLKMDGVAARPLWLLGLGRNGYWPVARLDDGPAVPLLPDTFSISWLALYCASLAGCLVWLGAAVAARHRWVGGLVDIRVEKQWPDWQIEARSLTILTAIIGTAFATASMPIWWSAFRQEDIANGWIIAFWTGLLALTAAGIVPWVSWDSKSLAKQAVLGLIAALPVIGVIAVNVLSPKKDNFLLLHFFLLRSQDYLSGIAPILPFLLLLLGFVGCAWSWHLGTVLSEERYVRLGALGSPTFCRIQFHYAALAICLIAAVPVALVSVHALHSLEPVLFDRAYILLLCLLLVATYYACFRFVAMWQQVKSLLARLELHPMHAALEAMPKEKDGAPI